MILAGRHFGGCRNANQTGAPGRSSSSRQGRAGDDTCGIRARDRLIVRGKLDDAQRRCRRRRVQKIGVAKNHLIGTEVRHRDVDGQHRNSHCRLLQNRRVLRVDRKKCALVGIQPYFIDRIGVIRTILHRAVDDVVGHSAAGDRCQSLELSLQLSLLRCGRVLPGSVPDFSNQNSICAGLRRGHYLIEAGLRDDHFEFVCSIGHLSVPQRLNLRNFRFRSPFKFFDSCRQLGNRLVQSVDHGF